MRAVVYLGKFFIFGIQKPLVGETLETVKRELSTTALQSQPNLNP
jgi:hypothetical protein